MIEAIESRENTIDSREVAKMIEKEHKNLIRDIRVYTAELGELKIEPSKYFKENTYRNSQNKELPCFEVTKKGCEFIAHKLTGSKGTEFTARYIERFHAMEDSIRAGFNLAQLSPELQAIFAHDQKIQAVVAHMEEYENRIGNLEDTMTVDYGQQKELNDLHHSRGAQVLGGKLSPAYRSQSIKHKVYREIWKDYKDYFEVATYKDTPVSRFDEAKTYLQTWEPDMNLRMEIANAREDISA